MRRNRARVGNRYKVYGIRYKGRVSLYTLYRIPYTCFSTSVFQVNSIISQVAASPQSTLQGILYEREEELKIAEGWRWFAGDGFHKDTLGVAPDA